MTTLRVVHIISQPDGGGAQRLVRELTQRLPAHGVETRAIYFCNPKSVEFTPRESELGLSGDRDPRAIWKLRHALKQQLSEETPTLVHGHLTWPLYFLPLALAGHWVPKIYTEHNTLNKRRDYPVLRPLERAVYRRYQRIACISQGTKDSLGAWLGDVASDGRVEVVPNGSRLLPFSLPASHSGTGVRLVSVGTLTLQKGLDVALQAVAALGEVVESYTIVGEGPERAKLEALARELGIRDKIYLPGYVNDVTPYFHRADLGLIPSRWEGFGLVAVEALSTGLPLVASDVAGMREVLEDCPAATLVAPLDASSFANGIRHAVDHLVGRVDIAKVARKHSERFGIESMVEHYKEMYRQVFEETGRNK